MSSLSNILLSTVVAFSAMVAAGPVPTASSSCAVSTATGYVPTTTTTVSTATGAVPSATSTSLNYLDQAKLCVNKDPSPVKHVYPTGTKGLDELESLFPNYYRVRPGKPDSHENPYDSLYLESYNSSSQVETIIQFKKIPSNAVNCSLHLQIGNVDERMLLTSIRSPSTGHGESQLFDIEILNGMVTDGKVTHNAIQKYRRPDGRVGAFELGGWDHSEQKGQVTGSYGVPCRSELSIKLAYRQICSEKRLYLKQDSINGLFLRYELE